MIKESAASTVGTQVWARPPSQVRGPVFPVDELPIQCMSVPNTQLLGKRGQASNRQKSSNIREENASLLWKSRSHAPSMQPSYFRELRPESLNYIVMNLSPLGGVLPNL